MFVYIHVYIYICICTYIHVYVCVYIHTESILNICWFSVCEFAYLLNFTCNVQTNIYGALGPFVNTHREATLELLSARVPGELEWGHALPSSFSFHNIKKCPFLNTFSAMFFTFSCFLLVISLVRMAHSAALKSLWSGVPKC